MVCLGERGKQRWIGVLLHCRASIPSCVSRETTLSAIALLMDCLWNEALPEEVVMLFVVGY